MKIFKNLGLIVVIIGLILGTSTLFETTASAEYNKDYENYKINTSNYRNDMMNNNLNNNCLENKGDSSCSNNMSEYENSNSYTNNFKFKSL